MAQPPHRLDRVGHQRVPQRPHDRGQQPVPRRVRQRHVEGDVVRHELLGRRRPHPSRRGRRSSRRGRGHPGPPTSVRSSGGCRGPRAPTSSCSPRFSRRRSASVPSGREVSTAPASGPRPTCEDTTPSVSSTRRASRTDDRLTRSCSASCRSPGRRSPTVRPSAAMRCSIWARTVSKVLHRDPSASVGVWPDHIWSDHTCGESRCGSRSSSPVSTTHSSPAPGRPPSALLRRLGVEVEFLAAQTCCGQMHLNTGYRDEAVKLANRFTEIFAGYDAVVAPSGSCAAMVRERVSPPGHREHPRRCTTCRSSWSTSSKRHRRGGLLPPQGHLPPDLPLPARPHGRRQAGQAS